MTSDVSLFINPAAGRGRGARAARPAMSALQAAGFTVRTVVGTDAPDALRRARQAVDGGTRALVAVGGDGMAHLALQAVAGTGVPLGLVAVGTGNDFARALGLPVLDARAAGELAAVALKEERTRAIDLGRVGGQWFGSVLASGFDSRVNDRGNRMKWPAGRLKYDLAVLAELATFRTVPYRITLDGGRTVETDATLVAVGNGPSYGGGLKMCAGADLGDGLFDITVVGRATRRTLLRVFPSVYRGAHLDHPAVTTYRAARVELDAPGTTAYTDGERLGTLPVTAECVHAAVHVLAP